MTIRWIHRLRRRFRALLRREELERELEDELRIHVEMEAEELVHTRDLTPEEARRQAMIAFGGAERYKEEVREARGVRGSRDSPKIYATASARCEARLPSRPRPS